MFESRNRQQIDCCNLGDWIWPKSTLPVWYVKYQFRECMPNHLLQWRGIQLAKSQGGTVYDMWGAPNRIHIRMMLCQEFSGLSRDLGGGYSDHGCMGLSH